MGLSLNASTSLVGCCGLYCGACAKYQRKIKQAVENLREATNALELDKNASEMAKWEPAFQHYTEYETVLDAFVRFFGECQGCVAGTGSPDCEVRPCCRQKGYTICAECIEMDTCEKLLRLVGSLENLKRIKAVGVSNWAKEMQEKVNAGYYYGKK
jgi:hypothetical protein